MVKRISSTANPDIKNIRHLREKKVRDDTRFFFVEGIRLVIEAYNKKEKFDRIIFSHELLRSQAGQEFIEKVSNENPGILMEVDKKVFVHLAQKEGPQGLAAVIYQKWFDIETINSSEGGIWMGLDSVQDPGNLGSILRTLDAVGGRGIILLDQSTDVFHPTAARASTGALFSLYVIRTSQQDFIHWKKNHGLKCYGAVCEKSEDYQNVTYPDDLIILMGSEQKGLSQPLIEICDQLINIPMSGNVDSLNLASAASIILYEVYNQQRKRNSG